MNLTLTRPGINWVPLKQLDRSAADQNVAAAARELQARKAEWSLRLNIILSSKAQYAVRLRMLYAVADEMTAAAASFAACKRGCSGCCYQAVMVSQPEAKALGEAVGMAPRAPTEWPYYDPATGVQTAAVEELLGSFFGNRRPCPFLQGSECSIYEHRPLACRVHVNMAPTAESCSMDTARETATLDMRKLDEVYTLIGMSTRVTDIREYFPSEG